MSKYQITLTPIDKFFFGGDMTFDVGSQDKKFNERYSSYIIRSMMFPQQTSLLGMLRFLILRNAGEEIFKDGRIVDKKNAVPLIGSKSFSVNTDHTKNNFGMIKSLTHVRLGSFHKDKLTIFEFMPLYEKDVVLENVSTGSYNFKDILIPSMEDYKAKEPLEVSLTDGMKLEAHFVEDRRMGINRDVTTGKTDKDALFKQISYRFKNKEGERYCFVFEAEVDDSIEFEKYSGMVSVGGDNSQFIIGISKDVKDSNATPSISNAIYALSPMFLKKEEAELAAFAITHLMPFRFLTDRKDNTEDDKRSYHILNSKLERSPKYELYAPGSIFYFKDEKQKKEFIQMIESKKEFRQIGYNEYK